MKSLRKVFSRRPLIMTAVGFDELLAFSAFSFSDSFRFFFKNRKFSFLVIFYLFSQHNFFHKLVSEFLMLMRFIIEQATFYIFALYFIISRFSVREIFDALFFFFVVSFSTFGIWYKQFIVWFLDDSSFIWDFWAKWVCLGRISERLQFLVSLYVTKIATLVHKSQFS